MNIILINMKHPPTRNCVTFNIRMMMSSNKSSSTLWRRTWLSLILLNCMGLEDPKSYVESSETSCARPKKNVREYSSHLSLPPYLGELRGGMLSRRVKLV